MNNLYMAHATSTVLKQQQTLVLYASIMEEVKIRVAAIEAALGGSLPIHGALTREFCFLQLRMLCELIALGCLAAHGDIVATTNLRKEWSAGTIIAGLSALHPEFYPAPLKEETVSPGRKYFTAINSGYLTKPELLALNGLCGNVLHRGSMKKLLSSAKPPQLSLSDVAAAVNKLQTLLSIHTTLLVDGNTILICTMKNIQNNDKVQVALGTRDPAARLGAGSEQCDA
jgi:hypothetical protein